MSGLRCRPLLPPPTGAALRHYRHRAAARPDHCGMSRGFLPRGLSNTRPQGCGVRCSVLTRGRVSNKPKQKKPGTREGQLHGSSIVVLAVASPARLWIDCGRAAEPLIRSLRSAMRQFDVPLMNAWRPAKHSQPRQAARALATGLIEPPEPADTLPAPAPQPRCRAASVCRVPRSRLGQQSAWPHR